MLSAWNQYNLGPLLKNAVTVINTFDLSYNTKIVHLIAKLSISKIIKPNKCGKIIWMNC